MIGADIMGLVQKRRNKNRTGLITLVCLAVILMIASVVLALRFPKEDGWASTSEPDINNPTKTGFACDTIEAQKLYPFANGLVKVNKDRVSFLDLKGNEIFGEVIDMDAPFCTISSKRAFIGDSNGFQYIVIDSSKVLYKSTIKGTIDYASINEDGYVAIVADEPGVKGVVKILNPEGDGLFTWQSAESGYILSSKINPTSNRVDISLSNTDGARVSPILKSFGIDGAAKGQFISQTNDLLPIILYDNDKDVVMCGSSRIIAFDGIKEKYSISFLKIYTVVSSDYGILLIAKTQNSDKPMFYVLDSKGATSPGIELSDEVSEIAVKGSVAAIGSGNTIIGVSINNKKVISRNPISASPIRIAFSSTSNQLIIVARDGVTTCTP